MVNLPKHLRKLSRAMKQIKERKLDEVRAQFPPWYTRRWLAGRAKELSVKDRLKREALYAIVSVVLAKIFSELIEVLGLHGAEKVVICVLYLILYIFLVVSSNACLGVLRDRWFAKHGRLFDDVGERERALRKVEDELDDSTLVQMAFEDLRRIAVQDIPEAKGYRLQDHARVRIVADIVTAEYQAKKPDTILTEAAQDDPLAYWPPLDMAEEPELDLDDLEQRYDAIAAHYAKLAGA